MCFVVVVFWGVFFGLFVVFLLLLFWGFLVCFLYLGVATGPYLLKTEHLFRDMRAGKKLECRPHF